MHASSFHPPDRTACRMRRVREEEERAPFLLPPPGRVLGGKHVYEARSPVFVFGGKCVSQRDFRIKPAHNQKKKVRGPSSSDGAGARSTPREIDKSRGTGRALQQAELRTHSKGTRKFSSAVCVGRPSLGTIYCLLESNMLCLKVLVLQAAPERTSLGTLIYHT
jgi:hypothetical protein